MVWATSPPLAVATVVLRLADSGLPVAMLWVGKLIVDGIVAIVSDKGGDAGHIWTLLAVEAGLAVLSDLLGRATVLCDSLLGDRFTNHMSLRMMEHANHLDLVSFEDPVFYDKLERARRQTTGRLGMIASIASMCQQMVTLLTMSAGIVMFSPWLLPLLTIALAPAFLGETRFAMLSYSLLYRWTPERRQLDYLRMLGASNASAKEVRIFGLGRFLIERARDLFDRFYDENRSLAIRRASTGTLLNLLPTVAYYGAYAYILSRTLTGALTVGDLTFLAGAFARSRTLMAGIFARFSDVADQAQFLDDLFDFFRTEPAIVSAPNAIPAPRPIREGFEFRNVSFAYPGSSRLVLDACIVPAGGRGADCADRRKRSGEDQPSQSSWRDCTIPWEGRFCSTESICASTTYRNFAGDRRHLPGLHALRHGCVRHIGLGRVEAMHSEDRIADAARMARADVVIDSLPERYAQMLGRRFEGGVDLSAGQWQKIALARAYMRDAQVLVLDEPTASLDARAEYEVFQQFTVLTRDRMAVLISHRFSTVRMADRILVLENGRILEQGTHEQLLAKAGRYSELFELQAAGYR